MIIKNILKVGLVAQLLLFVPLGFSAPNSNVKPIPSNFSGKWAGLHSTKQKLDKTILKDLCDNGGDQNTSFFVTFDEDSQSIVNVAYWEDVYTEYPVSYSKYMSNHIMGQSLSISFEMGGDALANKTVAKFDYKLANEKLYIKTPTSTLEMMRCI